MSIGIFYTVIILDIPVLPAQYVEATYKPVCMVYGDFLSLYGDRQTNIAGTAGSLYQHDILKGVILILTFQSVILKDHNIVLVQQ